MLDKILSLVEWIYQSIKGMTVKVDYISDVKDGSTAEVIEEFTDTDKAVSARSAAVLKAYIDSQIEEVIQRIENNV